MKPKGLVAAASMTSQMSIPMRMPRSLSSFTRAMLTQRKMFSRSLVISAARVELTGNARDDLRVEGLGGASAGRIEAADNLGNLREAELLVARILALGRKGEEEVRRDVFAFRSGGDRTLETALFEDGEDKLLGGARVRGGFEGDKLAALQMRLNRDGGLFDETQVGIAAFVEGRGNADDDSVGFLQFGEIRGGLEMAAVDELLNLILRNVLDIGFARIELGDLGGIGIETGHFVPGFRKAQSQGKSHVATADDGDFELRTFEKFRLAIGWHTCASLLLVRAC